MCAITRVADPPAIELRPVPMVARLSIGSADVADQVAGVVGPHVVDQGLQLAGTHRAHRVLLTTRSVRPQQFLQEAFGRIKVALPHRFPSRLCQP